MYYTTAVKLSTDTTLSAASLQTGCMTRPIAWFEIPALDFDCARSFYETLFGIQLTVAPAGPSQLGVFPYDRDRTIGGCIMLGPGMTPSTNGTVVYLDAGDLLDPIVERVAPAGGKVVVPKTEVPGIGYFVHIIDSEGNRVGLFGLK